MSPTVSRDFRVLEMDPLTEIIGNTVFRQKDRKLREYLASQVVFIQSLFSLVECLVPGCGGHQRFGYVAADNVAVFFKYHDKSLKEGVYVPYRNPLCRPFRVPMDDDAIITGIRWNLKTLGSSITPMQSMFDCLIANLKLQSLMKRFCLECLFMHRNGLGLLLERLIKTVLLHVVAFGRYVEREDFFPVTRFEEGMTLRLKRAFFEKDGAFKQVYMPIKDGFREDIIPVEKNLPTSSLPSPLREGRLIDLDFSILRHLNTVSTYDVTLQCGCDAGRQRTKKAYIGVLRRNHRHGFFNMSLAEWKLNGETYEDPLWFHSLFSHGGPNASVTKVTATPLAKICEVCQNMISIRAISVPETSWLLMSEIAEPLSKSSLEGLSDLHTYVMGGVSFKLAYIIVYNQDNGNFSSMNFNQNTWSYYDDGFGGLLKHCRPEKIKYKNRVNLRAVYLRQTDPESHRCLSSAHKHLRS